MKPEGVGTTDGADFLDGVDRSRRGGPYVEKSLTWYIRGPERSGAVPNRNNEGDSPGMIRFLISVLNSLERTAIALWSAPL